MSRKWFSLFGLSVIGAIALNGCGGSSSSSASPNAVFQGVFIAPYTDSGSNTDSGEYAIHISPTGAITGFYIDTTSNVSAQITSGQITLTSSTVSTHTGTVTVTNPSGTVTGTFTLSGNSLNGTVTDPARNLTVNFSSGLANVAGGNAYAGWYQGSYVEPSVSNGVVGLVAIIDASGNITWLQNQTTSSTGTIVSSTGVATFTPPGGTAHSGALAFTGTQSLTGTLNNVAQNDLLNMQFSYDLVGA